MTVTIARYGARKTMTLAPDSLRSQLIDIAVPCAGWRRALPDVANHARQAAQAVLARGGKRLLAVELSLVLADDAAVAALNERWRGRSGPTNVLAFASKERAMPPAPLLLGDVVLAYETVAREAREQRKTLSDHLRHLVIHGVLHLLGYDHESAGPARRMEMLETRILAALGVANPYRVREDANG